jgi:hypothetical protein
VLFRYRGGARNYYCHNWRNDISVLLTAAAACSSSSEDDGRRM